MKNIIIISFIEFLSEPLRDTIIFCENNRIPLKISNRSFKEAFNYYYKKYLTDLYNRISSRRVIFVNPCYPKRNWKNKKEHTSDDIDYKIKFCKEQFNSVFDRLELSKFIDKIYKQIKEDWIYKIECNNFDMTDVVSVVKDYYSKDFIDVYINEYPLVYDINSLNFNKKIKMSLCIKTKIEEELRKQELIYDNL